MKKLFFPIIFVLLAWSCSPTQKAGVDHKRTSVQIDSTEYEVIIIDPEFETWYLMNYSPSKDYSNEYYRSRNRIGILNWNDYFDRGRYYRVIENHIFYDPSVDYGIEVNRKLYWYFKYIEENYRIRLLR